jgi:hypothetical protein
MEIPDEEEADKLLDKVSEEGSIIYNKVDKSNDSNRTNKSTIVNYLPTSSNKNIVITKNGAFIKFEYFNISDAIKLHKVVKKIENKFTLSTKLITGRMKSIKSCKVDKKKERIVVPRFGIFEILNSKYGLSGYSTKSQIKSGEDAEYKWHGKLSANQELVVEVILDKYYTDKHVRRGSAGVILNMIAGHGKSYVASYLISKIQKKACIILHSSSLIKQWERVLRLTLGPDVSIGYYFTGKHILGDIMIMIIDSATHNEFKFKKDKIINTYTALDYYNQFGFIIYDECHTYANKFCLKALKIAQAPYMLGLSATPDENTNGFDPLVWWEIGPLLDASAIPGYETETTNFKAVVHRVMYYGPPKYTKHLTTEMTDTVITNNAATINMICEDEIRNSLVIDCVVKGLNLGLNMFVFADRREYLTNLQILLRDTMHVEGEVMENEKDYIRIVGGATDDDLANAEIESKVIFTTFPFMGTGKSIPKMNGLVLAHPRKSKMKQYINRIFRMGSDINIERHIWDICDMKLKCGNQWSTRKKHYDSVGYKILTEKVKYEEWEMKNVKDVEGGCNLKRDVEDCSNLKRDDLDIMPKTSITDKKAEKIKNAIMALLRS